MKLHNMRNKPQANTLNYHQKMIKIKKRQIKVNDRTAGVILNFMKNKIILPFNSPGSL
ncbi:hypothetical protein J2X14_001916 [Pantoea alhagi]|uniref:hypothetical protein n=1 Tax=Mixta sp. BE291 TaxID=3158787 RepID=UPI002856339C|nr:hypothetical protein [Pantoea alhagi]